MIPCFWTPWNFLLYASRVSLNFFLKSLITTIIIFAVLSSHKGKNGHGLCPRQQWSQVPYHGPLPHLIRLTPHLRAIHVTLSLQQESNLESMPPTGTATWVLAQPTGLLFCWCSHSISCWCFPSSHPGTVLLFQADNASPCPSCHAGAGVPCAGTGSPLLSGTSAASPDLQAAEFPAATFPVPTIELLPWLCCTCGTRLMEHSCFLCHPLPCFSPGHWVQDYPCRLDPLSTGQVGSLQHWIITPLLIIKIQ